MLEQGFLFQGQVSPHLGAPRGEPSGHLPPTAFVLFLQNHDQVGNRAFGERLNSLADPEALRAATSAAAAFAADPDAVHGRGMGRHARRSSSSPTTTPSWRRW